MRTKGIIALFAILIVACGGDPITEAPDVDSNEPIEEPAVEDSTPTIDAPAESEPEEEVGIDPPIDLAGTAWNVTEYS
jgi:hypothetical protein